MRDAILDDPGWLIAIKGLLVFVFCVVCTLLAIWFERRIVARMQLRLGPIGWASSVYYKALPMV